MNAARSTLARHRGSSEAAPNWRGAVGLAVSIALHALLLLLFLRPAQPAPSPGGRSDVVTVYLRDSRKLSPPSQPQSARAQSRRTEARPEIAQTPRAPGQKPVASIRGAKSAARDEPASGKPARTTDKVAALTPPRSIEVPRSKPSPIDQQGNRAADSRALYLRELAARLSQVKHYPQLAVALRQEGTVLVSFQIDRDGRLLAWSIASSSGHDTLDREVGRMIAAAAPFPPFPPSWNQPEKVFEVPIGFYLH